MHAEPIATTVQVIPPSLRFRGHEHGAVHLCIVADGAVDEHVSRGTVTMTEGHLRISPPCAHDLSFGPTGARCVIAEISEDDARVAVGRRLNSSEFFNPEAIGILGRRIGAILLGTRPVEREEAILEILARLGGDRVPGPLGPPPSWLREARDRLADEWRSPPHASEVAHASGVHRVHLVRSFRRFFGCTPGTFVRRRRLWHARELLHAVALPLSQVAMAAGFADQAHLTREMRQCLGVTPAEYRRLVRKGPPPADAQKREVTPVQY